MRQKEHVPALFTRLHNNRFNHFTSATLHSTTLSTTKGACGTKYTAHALCTFWGGGLRDTLFDLKSASNIFKLTVSVDFLLPSSTFLWKFPTGNSVTIWTVHTPCHRLPKDVLSSGTSSSEVFTKRGDPPVAWKPGAPPNARSPALNPELCVYKHKSDV